MKEIYKMITDKTCKVEGFTKDKIIKKIKQNKYIFLKFDWYVSFNIRQILDNMPRDILEFMREFYCIYCMREERENLFKDCCKFHYKGKVIDNVLRIYHLSDNTEEN